MLHNQSALRLQDPAALHPGRRWSRACPGSSRRPRASSDEDEPEAARPAAAPESAPAQPGPRPRSSAASAGDAADRLTMDERTGSPSVSRAGQPWRAPATAGDLVELDVGPVAHGGHCVARHEGQVVFVRHALPGERVVARLTEARRERPVLARRRGRGARRPSPDRVGARPRARSARRRRGCGGCDWQHVRRPRRSAGSRPRSCASSCAGSAGVGAIADLVGRAGPRGRATGSAGAPGCGSRSTPTAGPGLRRAPLARRSCPSTHCPIAHPEVDALGVGGRRWPGRRPSRSSRRRRGRPGGAVERLVVVEPSEPSGAPDRTGRRGPTGRRGSTCRRSRWSPWRAESGRLQRSAAGRGSPSGCAWTASRATFRVTGGGFWQVHPGRAQTLLDAVLDAAGPRPGERALDLYCGVGLFRAGLAAAGRGRPGRSLGVEGDARAVRGRPAQPARPAAGAAGHRPGRARRSPAAAADPALARRRRRRRPRPAADGRGPARSSTRCSRPRPRVVVYVACDPAALARDVATAAAGWVPAGRAAGLRPVPDDPPRRVRRDARPGLTGERPWSLDDDA